MGALLSILGPALPAIFGFIERMLSKPTKPPAFQAPPGKSPDELIAEARRDLGIDAVSHYNIAFSGPSGTGKSSLINILLGLRAGDPGAAPEGETECTMEVRRYDHPTLPNLKLWDIPGAGTDRHPAATYFADKRLYAFDAVLVIGAGRFLEVSQAIAEGAAQFKCTIAFEWAKADLGVSAIRRRVGGTLADARIALRRDVEASFRVNKLSAHRLFLVSAWDIADGTAGLDENALLVYLEEAARARSA